jgi:LysR family transcriptional regulator, glycine cleavage system transcriptional activator
MATPPPVRADLRLPSLDALRAFETAARLGTFERAADALCISASAVGKRITALEDLLGLALFQRGAKTLSLSAGGKEYLAQVSAALLLLDAVPQHQRVAQQRQRLRINAPPTFARQILVAALPLFTQAHPEVELEVLLSTPYMDLPAPEAELDVRHGPVGPHSRVLMQDLLIPLASPGLLAEAGPLREAADLGRLPLLRTPVEPWSPWFQAAGLDWPEPDQGPRLVDLGMTLEAALCGQGVVLARPSLARQALRAGLLRPVLGVASTPVAQAIHAYQLLPHGDDALTEAAAAWLGQACERAAADGLALISGPA